MAATRAVLGFGTQWQAGDGQATENFTTVLELHDIPDFGSVIPLVKATHQQSPNQFEEYIGGIKDGTEVAIVGAWVPFDATQNSTVGIRANHINETRNNYRVVFPTSPVQVANFPALVVKFTNKAPMAGLLDFTASFKVVGPITMTY